MPATITWTPLPAEPLIVAQEDETNLTATVTATVEAAPTGGTGGGAGGGTGGATEPTVTVESLTWATPVPLPPQITVATSGATLTLTVPNFIGLFPIEIDYLATPYESSLATATSWQGVPASAPEVIAVRPDSSNVKNFTIEVTARDGDGLALDTAAFVLQVFANYNLARDALVEAVNARR